MAEPERVIDLHMISDLRCYILYPAQLTCIF